MRKGVAGVVAIAWIGMAAGAAVKHFPDLYGRVKHLGVSSGVRADIEGGDDQFHRLLDRVRARAPRGDVLLMMRDQYRLDEFFYYRASYELYPVRVLFVPVASPPAPSTRVPIVLSTSWLGIVFPADGTFILKGDEAIDRAVKERKVALAAFYDRSRSIPPAVMEVKAAPGRTVRFRRLRDIPAVGRDVAATAPRGWAWLAGMAWVFVCGWLTARGTLRGGVFAGHRPARAAFSFLCGIVVTSGSMFLLSSLGLRWNPVLILCVLTAVSMLAWYAGGSAVPAAVPPPEPSGPRESGWADRMGMLLLGISLGWTAMAVMAPASASAGWDAWAIWHMKAKALWLERGIPSGMLLEEGYRFAHPQYPLGIASVQAFLAMCAGGMDGSLLRLVTWCFFPAMLAIMHALLGQVGIRRGRLLALGCFATLPIVMEHSATGYMDLPLSCACLGATALLVDAVRRGRLDGWGFGLMAALAFVIKAEGTPWALSSIVVAGVLVLRRRIAFKALAISATVLAASVLPMQAQMHSRGVQQTDFGFHPARLLAEVPARIAAIARLGLMEALGPGATMRDYEAEPVVKWGTAWHHLRDSWLVFWHLFIVACIWRWRGWRNPVVEAVALLLCLQGGAYLVAYLGSTANVTWHVLTSADRLLLHLAPAALVMAAALWDGGAEPPGVCRGAGT